MMDAKHHILPNLFFNFFYSKLIREKGRILAKENMKKMENYWKLNGKIQFCGLLPGFAILAMDSTLAFG